MFIKEKPVKVYNLLTAATEVGVSVSVEPQSNQFTYQGYGSTGADDGDAQADIEGSLDGINLSIIDSLFFTLSTAVSTVSGSADTPWKYVRVNLLTINGTAANVSIILGYN